MARTRLTDTMILREAVWTFNQWWPDIHYVLAANGTTSPSLRPGLVGLLSVGYREHAGDQDILNLSTYTEKYVAQPMIKLALQIPLDSSFAHLPGSESYCGVYMCMEIKKIPASLDRELWFEVAVSDEKVRS